MLLIAYVVVQATFTATATIPPRLVKQRSVISAFWATVCINSGNYIFSKKPFLSPIPKYLLANFSIQL